MLWLLWMEYIFGITKYFNEISKIIIFDLQRPTLKIKYVTEIERNKTDTNHERK